ncbi:MarR family winged helix-turn-helix transcriptional regulator [Actinomycetospora atypica]|uniref:MarR family winged helix-turn-helix transcriptional regulator n=1 Tax=Actinomycetospora atypica TaxID=1290095 RepID=A0ABV9YPY3_9PSEU
MTGGELALRLIGGFRSLIDDLHAELARLGHPEVRPVHGFALQAIGPQGTSASELAGRLGVSKQAAGKTVDALVSLDYAAREPDPADARRKAVVPTARGREVLRLSAEILERLRAQRAERVGDPTMREFEKALRLLTAETAAPLDTAGWLDT